MTQARGQKCSCGNDPGFKGLGESRIATQTQAEREPGGHSAVEAPDDLAILPAPWAFKAFVALDVHIAVPQMAFIDGARRAMLSVQLREELGRFGQQSCVVFRRWAGQSVPACGAMRILTEIEIEKSKRHARSP